MNAMIVAAGAIVVLIIIAVGHAKPELSVPYQGPRLHSEVPTEASGPRLCMPCVGPHMTFSGRFSVFSMGGMAF